MSTETQSTQSGTHSESPVPAPAPSGTAGADGSPDSGTPGLWRGRIMLIAGIILLGVTLRHAVTGLSPLLPLLRQELGLDVAGGTPEQFAAFLRDDIMRYGKIVKAANITPQ